NAATLPLAAYFGNLDFQLAGFHGERWQKLALITANFMFIDTLITVSCSALLKGLEKTLLQQRLIARSLQEGKARLAAANEELSRITAQVPGMVYRVYVTPNGHLRFTFVSPGARTIFGVGPQEVLADPL